MNRKTILVLGVAVIAIGYVSMNKNDSQLFKGMLSSSPTDNTETVSEFGDINYLPPDLVAAIKVTPPKNDNDDITVDATIKNEGEGDLRGVLPFEYEIMVDGQVVFTNVDSYSTMAPGDEFNFSYPIPRNIYKYGSSGEIKFVVDSKNAIKESNEDNNSMTVKF